LFSSPEQCPIPIVQEIPPPDFTTTYIAIAAGSGVALVLAIGAAFLISRSKSDSDLLLNGIDPFGVGTSTVASGIYQEETVKGQNQLFVGSTK